MMTNDAPARAAARRTWPVKRFALGHEPNDNLEGTTTAAERLAMLWELSASAWGLSGHGIPTYPRSQAPGRVVRPH